MGKIWFWIALVWFGLAWFGLLFVVAIKAAIKRTAQEVSAITSES